MDDLRPFATTPDILAGFSGRGPSVDLRIKPDLTAPGVAIHTASNGDGFTLAANGTSFATPIVSGGAALLVQKFPNWSAAQIKSALVNSAVRVVKVDGAPGLANQVGNGRLDLGRSLRVPAFMNPVSTSFANMPAASTTRRNVEVTNAVSQALDCALSVEVLAGGSQVMIEVTPVLLQLDPFEAAAVSLDVSPMGAATNGAFEGALTLSCEGRISIRQPFWGTLAPNSIDTLLVGQSSKQAPFTSLGEALLEAGPGDTIEIIDSSVYDASIVLDLNRDGTRLSGMTLRGAAGELPTIRASEEKPAVEVRNLRDVTLHNLLVQGTETGIKALDSSIKMIAVRVETEGPPSDQSGAVHLERSGAHIVDSELAAAAGNGLAVFTSDALVSRTRIGSEENGSAVHGVFASPGSTLSVFDSWILRSGESSTGQGIRASSSRILVKGSLVGNSQGSLGDGVLAVGDSQLNVYDSLVTNNQRAGVSSFNGAMSSIKGSEIEDNQVVGVLSQAAAVQVASSLLAGNGKGAMALELGQLDMRDTIIAASEGDGVQATDSQLTLLNATVFGNQGAGVLINSTPAHVANSILFQNLAGDVQEDGSSFSVTFNLVGDLAPAGADHNFTVNPAFSNPQGLDFSLTADSDAVDRGTHDVPVSANDQKFHRRVVDGNGDGEARVDVGALEFGSEVAEPLILPVLTSEPGHFIGLALANAFSSATVSPLLNEVEILAYDSAGSPLESFRVDVPNLTQDAFVVRERIPDLEEGWLEIRPSLKDLMGFTLTGDAALTGMDGSRLSPPQGSRLFFPEIRNGEGEMTTLFVVNPRPSPLDMTFYWHPSGLEKAVIAVVTVPASGSLKTTLEELGESGSSGYLSAEAARSFFAMELFGTRDSWGGLLALDAESSDSVLYGAQLAVGPQVDTVLNLINTGPAEVDASLTVMSEAGEILASRVQGLDPSGHLSASVRDLFDLGDDVVEGWLAVESANGQLLGSVSFEGPGGQYLAALPLQTRGAREFLLSQVAQTDDIFTGVTLFNVSKGRALISVEVFTSEGALRGTALLELEENQKGAFLLLELFPALGIQQKGFIRVRANRPILGFELFGRRDLEFLSAVPQQTVVY